MPKLIIHIKLFSFSQNFPLINTLFCLLEVYIDKYVKFRKFYRDINTQETVRIQKDKIVAIAEEVF